jgi:hypothetical protein
MPSTKKVLFQSSPGATTLTAVYTVPAATETVVSSLFVCNRGATDTTFRISVAIGGAADANQQYIYYNVDIPANDSFNATVGLTLGAGDVIRVYAAAAQLSFSGYGVELT